MRLKRFKFYLNLSNSHNLFIKLAQLSTSFKFFSLLKFPTFFIGVCLKFTSKRYFLLQLHKSLGLRPIIGSGEKRQALCLKAFFILIQYLSTDLLAALKSGKLSIHRNFSLLALRAVDKLGEY